MVILSGKEGHSELYSHFTYSLSAPPLVFLLWACSDLILSFHIQGQARERINTICISVGIPIANISPLPKAANTQHPKEANTMSNPHVSHIYPLPLHKNLQKGLHSGSWLSLYGWTYHHRTSVEDPKFHTVNPHPSNFHTYCLYLPPQNISVRPKTPHIQPPPFQPPSLSPPYFHQVQQEYLLCFHGCCQELFNIEGMRPQDKTFTQE